VLGAATAWFRGRQILHVPVTGLDALARAVADATVAWGEGADDPLFSGHLTLARVRRRQTGPANLARDPHQRRMDGGGDRPHVVDPRARRVPVRGRGPGAPGPVKIQHEHLFANYTLGESAGDRHNPFVWSAGSERRTRVKPHNEERAEMERDKALDVA